MDALEYLLHQQLLTVDKYLRCGKRQIKGYLKYVPDDIRNRVNRYLLQRRLLDIEITTKRESMRPCDHARWAFWSNPVCVDFLDPKKKRKSEEHEISQDPDRLVLENRRRKVKPKNGHE